MAQHSLDKTKYPDNVHIECPRCGHHSVVKYGKDGYACLHCSWRRDVSSGQTLEPIVAIIVVVVLIAIVITQG